MRDARCEMLNEMRDARCEMRCLAFEIGLVDVGIGEVGWAVGAVGKGGNGLQ